MPTLTVIDRDAIEHIVNATAGMKLMEVLRELDYGVAAICGGLCSCATCHVYIDPRWLERLPPPGPDERELVAALANYRANSRLSCQIEIAAAIDGLTLIIAPEE